MSITRMVSDIAINCEFAIDKHNFYPDCTLFLIPEGSSELTGFLNSSVSQFFIRQICPTIRGAYRRFKALYVSQIPIPTASNTAAITQLVEQILVMKAVNPGAPVRELEREINERVYALYGLRLDEIRMIEELTHEERVGGVT